RSFPYWLQDTTSFWVGHGFKSWDPTIKSDPEGFDGATYEHMMDLAIQMGRTENMFSSVTNIYGLTGLILYLAFMIQLAWKLYRGSRRAPPGSYARALCEFSFVSLVPQILFCPFAGSALGINLFFFSLGIVAARPYLAASSAKPFRGAAPELPAFARPAFAEQRARFAKHRTG
ncbi:MAG TPA: hypothetical protein VHY22_15860, partial [Chthoniobacteraceae bacterium]|nr:hypothetical protein [Chthoniobacteraceae bacterium]